MRHRHVWIEDHRDLVRWCSSCGDRETAWNGFWETMR